MPDLVAARPVGRGASPDLRPAQKAASGAPSFDEQSLPPPLAHEGVAQYLLERGLISPADVLDQGFAVWDASSRNRNYRVLVRPGSGYLLKQATRPDATLTIAHEAGVYALLAQSDGPASDYLPRYHGYDPQSGILVLGLIPSGENLRSYQLQTRRLEGALGAALGRALAAVHRQDPIGIPSGAPPWVLELHRPDASMFREISEANIALIKILQGTPGFGDLLDQLRAEWRWDGLVHFDLKWDNCVVDPTHPETPYLVDWETACVGDTAWDLGSALSQFLSTWLFSIPDTGSEPPARFPALAASPLDEMKPAMQACWSTYAQARNMVGDEAEMELSRGVAFAAARLIQTAFEASQFHQLLTGAAILHLQVAFNMLTRPQQAATQFLQLAPALHAQ